MNNSDICEEVLNNIKNSLLQCKNNKITYNLEKSCNIKNCKNIQKYESSLHATKTKIIIPDELTSKYAVKYSVKERVVILEKE